jgi:uncharacterized protein
VAEPLVGLMYRGEMAGEIREAGTELDFVEFTAEHFLGPGRRFLKGAERLVRKYPVLLHGLDLSLGTAADPVMEETKERQDLAGRLEARAFSEHISFTKIPGRSIGCLSPLPFCDAAVTALERRSAALRARLTVPFRLENIAYYTRPPGDEMTEVEFLRRVMERLDADALLDLNNLKANAKNHGYSADAFLDDFPLERVTEIHIAGGEEHGDLFVDTHSTAPDAEVWRLLEIVAGRAPNLRHVTLEWDNAIPPFDVICSVLRKAREIVRMRGKEAEHGS